MKLLLLVSCFAIVPAAEAIVRKYYIAAKEVVWDYAPSGYNNYDNTTLSTGSTGMEEGMGGHGDMAGMEDMPMNSSDALMNTKYKKAQYFEYTDETFTTVKPTPESQGNLGPTIRAEVGDELEVTFMNMATLPYTMHPHGVKYDQANEGVYFKFSKGNGSHVEPMGTYVYKWSVPQRSGPGLNDGNAVMWMYHSHFDEVADVYAGLAGPLIIYKKGLLSPETGLPTDVDNEFVLLYQITDETASHYFAENCKDHGGCNETAAPSDASHGMANMMHGINGRIYANLDGLEMMIDNKIRWFVVALGSQADLHTSHWHGNVVSWNGHNTDVIDLLPASFRTVYMQPDAAGVWPIHCHVNEHMTMGMVALYTVHERKM